MIQQFIHWIWEHPDKSIEIFGAVTGTLYLFFSIKRIIWLWHVGLISSAVYVYVYFVEKFYADMGLYIYYVLISIYGWYHWKYGNRGNEKEKLPVSKIEKQKALLLSGVSLALFLLIGAFLDKYTDSPLPWWDSFTTSLSIVATWMLARKQIENWLIWLVVNPVAIGLYLYKGLIPTAILFSFYFVLAILGYRDWKKELRVRS